MTFFVLVYLYLPWSPWWETPLHVDMARRAQASQSRVRPRACKIAVLRDLEAIELDDGQVRVVAHRRAAQERLRHLLLERLLRALLGD